MILREHRAGDRATAAAVAGVLHHDVDGEPRVVGRGEAGEGDGERAVVAAAARPDPLGGAGLAGDPVAGHLRPPGRRRRRGRRRAPSSARSARAACSLTTRVRVAASVPTVGPSSVTAEPSIRLGRDADAAVGDGVDRRGHLQGVDRERLAEGDAVLGLRGHRRSVGQDARPSRRGRRRWCAARGRSCAGSDAAGRGENLSAASTVPMLDDLAMTPARVSRMVAVLEPVVDDAVLRGPGSRRHLDLLCAG